MFLLENPLIPNLFGSSKESVFSKSTLIIVDRDLFSGQAKLRFLKPWIPNPKMIGGFFIVVTPVEPFCHQGITFFDLLTKGSGKYLVLKAGF